MYLIVIILNEHHKNATLNQNNASVKMTIKGCFATKYTL
jgi:hypothetical protein